jgi:hypothetical protein
MNDNNSSASAQDKLSIITVGQLFAEKLENFKRKHLADHLTQEELASVTPDRVAAELLSIRVYWTLLDSRDTDFFLGLATCADMDEETNKRVAALVQSVRSADAAKVDEMWRYILFFLKCIKA